MKKLAISALLLAIGVFVISQLGSNGSYTTTAESETNDSGLVLATTSLPVRVSGMIAASDQAIISAETAGVIERYAVVEGETVYPGSLLVKQAAPVTAAELALRTAERELTAVEQAAAVDAADTNATQATIVASSAAELAILDTAGADNRVQEALQAVLAADESAVTDILAALRFIDTNRSLFDAASLTEYDMVVANLYGSVPTYLDGGLSRSVTSTEDIAARIAELRTTEEPLVTEVLNLHTLISTQLRSLIVVYEGAESDILDRQQAGLTSDVRDTYFTQRTTIIGTQAALVASGANLQTAIDIAAATAVASNQQVGVSMIDEAAAARQATYSAAVAAAAARAAASAEAMSAAKYAQSEVRATFAGVVVERYKEVGEYAAPGEPLLKLSGTGGRELTITVPEVFADTLAAGQTLEVDGQSVGIVDRFSPVSSGHVLTVVIKLTAPDFRVGTSLAGELILASDSDTYAVPRAYVSFTSTGAVVTDQNGSTHEITIIYDAGEMLYITGSDLSKIKLEPSYSISLSQ